VARPPFKVRAQEDINAKLGLDALPDRFVQVPIYTYNNADIKNEVDYDGCPFISYEEHTRYNDPEVFAPYDWMKKQDREPIKEMYDLTDEEVDALAFHSFESLTDESVALEFEGSEHPRENFFSATQWELNHQFQKVMLY